MNDRVNKGENAELGILARRRIEAAILAPIYKEMRETVGEEKARDILRRAIRRAAIDAGAEMASRANGEADLESFKAILPLWTKDDALTIEVIDDKPGVLDFNVAATRRPIAPWDLATSETSCPAIATARSAKVMTRASS